METIAANAALVRISSPAITLTMLEAGRGIELALQLRYADLVVCDVTFDHLIAR